MYKVFTSLWGKSPVLTELARSNDHDEDEWVFVTDTGASRTVENHSAMSNSWIATPPLIKTDQLPLPSAHLNPIENLLIEHASMSVYEDIASKKRHQRPKDPTYENKLDEDEPAQNPNLTSVHHRALTTSITTMDSSTSSLVAHQRHIHRLHQRRKRPSKLINPNSADEFKQGLTKPIDRTRISKPFVSITNYPST